MAEIVKGKIGNALTSTAADHVVAVADDIFDEQLENYQSVLNSLMAVLDENGDVQENPFHVVSNEEYIKAVVDSEGKLLFGIKADGKPYFPKNDMYHVIQKKLTKKYKVVHEGKQMVLPLREEGDNAVVYPSVNATAVEFDTYEEAKAYVDANGLEYKQSE